MIAFSPTLQTRAKAWIRRELKVFDFPNLGSTSPSRRWFAGHLKSAEHLLDYIMEMIKVTDIKGGRAEELLIEHFGEEDTPLFLHELSSWLRSPFATLEDWDGIIQYRAQ
jgi:hypothetical protein